MTLALETSLRAGSVALVDDGHVLGELVLDRQRRSAQTLAPAIVELLQASGKTARQINLVAVTIGPGSFTGLRVGVTTAKTFAYAARCDVIGLDTLNVIAAQVPTYLAEAEAAVIHVAMDAQRQELFVAEYRRGGGKKKEPGNSLERLGKTRTVSISEWLSELQSEMVVTGPGIDLLESRLHSGIVVVDGALRQPMAVTVARLADHAYEQGRRDDLWKLAPIYIRPSAAEEKKEG